jgi:hypothetical protein
LLGDTLRRHLHKCPQRAEVFDRVALVQALRICPPSLRPAPSPQNSAKHVYGVRLELVEVNRVREYARECIQVIVDRTPRPSISTVHHSMSDARVI